MNETDFKKKFLNLFEKKYGGYHLNISERFASGTPDTYLCIDGHSIWIEFKVKYNKPTRLQCYVLHHIASQYIKACVLRYNAGTFYFTPVNANRGLDWDRTVPYKSLEAVVDGVFGWMGGIPK